MTDSARAHHNIRWSAPDAEPFWTPPWATDALVDRLEGVMRKYPTVWEPACGTGRMASQLKVRGFNVVATDKHDWGYTALDEQKDFLDYDTRLADAIVTNPPFALANKFLEHAVVTLNAPFVAILAKLYLLGTPTRGRFFDAHPPTLVYVLGDRVGFATPEEPDRRQVGGFLECAWYVWTQYAISAPSSIDWFQLPRDERLRLSKRSKP